MRNQYTQYIYALVRQVASQFEKLLNGQTIQLNYSAAAFNILQSEAKWPWGLFYKKKTTPRMKPLFHPLNLGPVQSTAKSKNNGNNGRLLCGMCLA